MKLLAFGAFSVLTGVGSLALAFSRFDVVGFTFFLMTAAVAFAAFKEMKRWPVRLLPLLFIAVAFASCFSAERSGTAWARSVGATIAAQCTRDRSCPITPAGFAAATPGARVEREVVPMRATLTYWRNGDGLGFRIGARGPLGTTTFVGGVDQALQYKTFNEAGG